MDIVGRGIRRLIVWVPEGSSVPRFEVKISYGDEKQPESLKEYPKTEKWEWKIATSPPNIQYFTFNQESFEAVLMEIADA